MSTTPPEPETAAYTTGDLTPFELLDAWPVLSSEERLEGFKLLPHEQAQELFLSADAHTQSDIIQSLPASERRLWVRALAPDDAADLIQMFPLEERPGLLALLDDDNP